MRFVPPAGGRAGREGAGGGAGGELRLARGAAVARCMQAGK